MDILPFAPKPTLVRVLYLPVGRPTATAVMRLWGTVGPPQCTLCRLCTVRDGACLVGINRIVPKAEAEALSDRDCDWQREPEKPIDLMGQTP